MDCISFKENNMDNFKNYICKFEDNKLLSSFLLKTDSNTIHSIKNSMTISLKNISYFSNNKTSALTQYKIEELTKHVEKHNSVIERMALQEQKTSNLEKRLDNIEHILDGD